MDPATGGVIIHHTNFVQDVYRGYAVGMTDATKSRMDRFVDMMLVEGHRKCLEWAAQWHRPETALGAITNERYRCGIASTVLHLTGHGAELRAASVAAQSTSAGGKRVGAALPENPLVPVVPVDRVQQKLLTGLTADPARTRLVLKSWGCVETSAHVSEWVRLATLRRWTARALPP